MRVLYRGTQHFRVLVFDQADAPVERWRAAGLVTGSLLQSGEAPDSEAALVARRRSTSTRAATASRHGQSKTSAVHTDVSTGIATGPGLSDGRLRWGGWMAAELDFVQFLWAGAALRVMAQPASSITLPSVSGKQELDANWWWAGGMVGARWELGARIALRPGVGLGREWLNVHLEAGEVSGTKSAQRSYVSVWGSVVSAVRLTPDAQILFGVAATTTPGQVVTVAGRPVGSNRDVSAELTLGASYRVF